MDARETEVRAAALDSLQSSYEKLGRDLPKLVKLLGKERRDSVNYSHEVSHIGSFMILRFIFFPIYKSS